MCYAVGIRSIRCETKVTAVIQMHEMMLKAKRILKPAVVRISGLIGFALVAAAFLESLQDSLAAGG